MNPDNQFALLAQRRFGPFFLTQFLGAFNDNVFKNALIVMLAFHGVQRMGGDSNVLINISAGLFILPFFLFSASAGQFADKYDKALLIRVVKLLEIFIMLCAAAAFYYRQIEWLVAMLFLMGTQSTLFGPVKYSILPQHLSDAELVGGNGLIETGTFLAILLGTLVGGLLIGLSESGAGLVGGVLVSMSILGYIASRFVPRTAPAAPEIRINWNPISETWRTYKFARQNRVVFLSVLGVSWFWFLGATYLTQLPNYTKDILGGNEQVVTLMLVLFSLGIGFGSLLCERLSGRKVELGLVPFGAIGLTLFGIDLYFAAPVAIAATPVGIGPFLKLEGVWRVMVDIPLIGMFGGFYIVPLYALIQQRSEASHLSRIIAGNNILNAMFMVLASLVAILVLGKLNWSIPGLFLLVAVFNAVVAIYTYSLVPEFLMRFLVWMLIHVMYRVSKEGLEHIPERGPAVLVCNHVSLVDALIIAGCVRRPVRFVTYYKIYNMPVLNFIFRTAKAIPIAGRKEDPELMERAFDQISAALRDGELVCIFPEGKLTHNGEMNSFRPGVERILERDPVPVVPMALIGLWGSFFSRKGGKAMGAMPRRVWSRISLVVGELVAVESSKAPLLRERVTALLESGR